MEKEAILPLSWAVRVPCACVSSCRIKKANSCKSQEDLPIFCSNNIPPKHALPRQVSQPAYSVLRLVLLSSSIQRLQRGFKVHVARLFLSGTRQSHAFVVYPPRQVGDVHQVPCVVPLLLVVSICTIKPFEMWWDKSII